MLFRKQNDALPTVEWFSAFLNHYSPTTDPHFQIHSLSHPAVRYFWRLSHPLPCQVSLLNSNALSVISLGYLPPTGPEEMRKVHVFDLEWNGAKWTIFSLWHLTMNFSHVHKIIEGSVRVPSLCWKVSGNCVGWIQCLCEELDSHEKCLRGQLEEAQLQSWLDYSGNSIDEQSPFDLWPTAPRS